MNYDLQTMEDCLQELRDGRYFPQYMMKNILHNTEQEMKEFESIDDEYYKQIVKELHEECSKILLLK